MKRFSGELQYECNECKHTTQLDFKDLDQESVGADDRQMGPEEHFELTLDTACPQCGADVSIKYDLYEYPIGVINMFEDGSRGAVAKGSPSIDHLDD